MKRISACFEKITELKNLHSAFYKASRYKRCSSDYLYFRVNAEKNLQELRSRLLSGTYKPAPYKRFLIHDPKERLISAAAFEDRIVHHAIMNVLEPVFEKRQIYASFACRKGKGREHIVPGFMHCIGRSMPLIF